jgi:hypothetical protein
LVTAHGAGVPVADLFLAVALMPKRMSSILRQPASCGRGRVMTADPPFATMAQIAACAASRAGFPAK